MNDGVGRDRRDETSYDMLWKLQPFPCVLSQPRPRAYEAEVFRESCLGDTVVQILQEYTEASKK